MLYKDDVRVFLDEKTPIARRCMTLLEQLRSLATSKGIVRFKTLPGMKNPGLFIPLQATVKTPDGSYVMTYATNKQQKGDQIVYTPTTLRWPASGSIDLNRDPELAIFLYGFSTLCLNGRNPSKSNTCWFMIEDREGEAEVKITSKKLIGKVTTLVLETIDFGGAPLQLVMNYAKSKGMRFTEQESENVSRSKIFDMIETSDLYQEFIDSLTTRRYFENTNIVDKAVENNIIQIMRLSRTDEAKAWRMISREGVPEDVICKVPIRSNAKSYLLEELENNPYLVQKIRERLQEVMDEDQQISREMKDTRKDYPVQGAKEIEEQDDDPDETDKLLYKLLDKSEYSDKDPNIDPPVIGPVGPAAQPDPTGPLGEELPTAPAKVPTIPRVPKTTDAKLASKAKGKGKGKGRK